MKPCISVTEEAKSPNFHAVSELSTLGFAATSELQDLLLAPQIQGVKSCLTLAVHRGGLQGGSCDVMSGQMARDVLLKGPLNSSPLSAEPVQLPNFCIKVLGS